MSPFPLVVGAVLDDGPGRPAHVLLNDRLLLVLELRVHLLDGRAVRSRGVARGHRLVQLLQPVKE